MNEPILPREYFKQPCDCGDPKGAFPANNGEKIICAKCKDIEWVTRRDHA